MITALINLTSTVVVCFTVLAIAHMIINTYMTVKGLNTITRSGLVNWILNLLVQRVEKATGFDIPGYGDEPNKTENQQ